MQNTDMCLLYESHQIARLVSHLINYLSKLMFTKWSPWLLMVRFVLFVCFMLQIYVFTHILQNCVTGTEVTMRDMDKSTGTKQQDTTGSGPGA